MFLLVDTLLAIPWALAQKIRGHHHDAPVLEVRLLRASLVNQAAMGAMVINPMKHWNTHLPKENVPLLIRTHSGNYPVQVGHWDGMLWREDDGGKIHTMNVLGWMELDTAAKLLDGE